MRSRSGTASLVASPVLVGAVTVLIAIIAVFLAYNANKGLPFVPTYDVKAELPSGANLVKGNEVRIGGFRVGVVDDIRPVITKADGKNRSVALVTLKLDKTVEPLATDTKLRPAALGARPQVRGAHARRRQAQPARPATRSRSKNASEPLEFEDVFKTFDHETRPAIQQALAGFGDAFAGRGAVDQRGDRGAQAVLHALTPVMKNLSDPDTELDEFFKQIGRASAQVAPVAAHAGRSCSRTWPTRSRRSRATRAALQQTIEKSPPTWTTAIALVPRSAPVPRRVHRPVAPAAPGRAGAAALAARASTARSRSARRCCPARFS